MKVCKIILVLVTVVQTACIGQSSKINGISFVASRFEVKQENVDPVIDVNANYATVMPFGFIRSIELPNISYNSGNQWFGETKAGVKQYVEILKKNGIRVMLKPQIWISHGAYTGFIKMTTEKDWKTLEDSYRKFILDYAMVAEETNCEMFCIGTELEQFIIHRPDYWKQVILEIKQIYSGKLTYAANWDEYKRVPFWSELDYIGVDAYFPVSDSKTPSLLECKEGWRSWKQELKDVSQRENRKILFTEYGYRSVDYTAKEPWKSDRSMNSVNLEGQSISTQALFDEFWAESWFAGGFIWKWFINHGHSGGSKNSRFTPQNKPVEKIIRSYYNKKY